MRKIVAEVGIKAWHTTLSVLESRLAVNSIKSHKSFVETGDCVILYT